jgi:hypothetical protein
MKGQISGNSKKKQISGNSKKRLISGNSMKMEISGKSMKRQISGKFAEALNLSTFGQVCSPGTKTGWSHVRLLRLTLS